MLTILIYCLSVLVILMLIHFYQPNDNPTTKPAKQTKRKRPNSLIEMWRRRLDSSNSVLAMMPNTFESWDRLKQSVNDHCPEQISAKSSVNIIIGIDFTSSNEWHKNLHKITNPKQPNVYQRALASIGYLAEMLVTLEVFHSFRLFAYGFGDLVTKDKSVFSLLESHSYSVNDVLYRYSETVRRVTLSGPSCFAPVISKCQINSEFSILFILTDGELTDEMSVTRTRQAIKDASNYPLSIVVVSLRESLIKLYDDLGNITDSLFDNLSLVDFKKTSTILEPSSSSSPLTVTSAQTSSISHDSFSLGALSKLPEQLKLVRKLNYI